MANVLQAIAHIEETSVYQLNAPSLAVNRMNGMGDALEMYIKHAFASCLDVSDRTTIAERYERTFSYTGNANNIPDAMLQSGDAIEIKKIQSFTSGIPLNSSYPKDKLYADDHRINQACKACEDWDVKDMLYAIGVVKGRDLKHLWLVDGACYAADRGVYTRIEQTIRDGVNGIPDVQFSESKELGRVNQVDPLGITYLRIRGMWHIENPSKVFQDVHPRRTDEIFGLAALLPLEKYHRFAQEDRAMLEARERIIIREVDIPNPNNPVKRMPAVLIEMREI